jgi:hypothetical protein
MYRQFWISIGLRKQMRRMFGLTPRIKAYDTERGGTITYPDMPVINPHELPDKVRAVHLYKVDINLVDIVIAFVREAGGRITDETGHRAC